MLHYGYAPFRRIPFRRIPDAWNYLLYTVNFTSLKSFKWSLDCIDISVHLIFVYWCWNLMSCRVFLFRFNCCLSRASISASFFCALLSSSPIFHTSIYVTAWYDVWANKTMMMIEIRPFIQWMGLFALLPYHSQNLRTFTLRNFCWMELVFPGFLPLGVVWSFTLLVVVKHCK